MTPIPAKPSAPPVVSVVIVCMDQMARLRTCLDSLFAQNTRVPFETWVVAYRFSSSHLQDLRREYPGVLVVESDETRGFSENNNLALRQARGRYCFLLNDDTWMEMPVLDRLVDSFEIHPEAAIFMPKILNPDGSIQFCGGVDMTIGYWLFQAFHLAKWRTRRSRYANQPGAFRTRNILGAAFMIRTEALRALGFLDERYFFSPEDTALSTLANRRGYSCWVDAGIEIFHDHSSTLKAHYLPVLLALQRGNRLFFADRGRLQGATITLLWALRDILTFFYWSFRRGESARLHRQVWSAMLRTVFSRATPKELFVRYSCPVPSGTAGNGTAGKENPP